MGKLSKFSHSFVFFGGFIVGSRFFDASLLAELNWKAPGIKADRFKLVDDWFFEVLDTAITLLPRPT